ncbi:hypothetical protein ES703_102890 [subsurface metagenome]
MYPGFDRIFTLLGYGQQLYRETQFAGIAEVAAGESRNTFTVNILRAHLSLKGQRSQDSQFIIGIYPFDVVFRVGLGIAQFLRLLESRGKVHALPGHHGEDIIGGAVDDGEDAADIIGHQVMFERGNQRDTPADTGFILQTHAALPCQSQQLRAVLGNKFLIRSHRVFTVR